MSGESWGRSLRGGVAWSTVTFVLAKTVAFLSTLVLARLLVPSQFGAVAAVTSFLALVELGSDLGMKATVVYEQEKGHSERLDTAFTLNITIVVVFVAIGLAAAPLVASFFHLHGQAYLFRLGILSLLLTGLGNIHDGLLLRDLAFRRRIAPEFIRGVVRGVVAIVFAALGYGAESLVFGMLAGSAVWTITQWSLTPYRPKLRFSRGIARTMIAYGIGASLLQVITTISQNADTAAIGRIVGATALGIYTVGFRVPDLIIQNVSQEVSIVAFPALARKRAEDEQGLGAASMKLLRYQALYSLPVAAGIAVMASPLIVVLFSSKWREAGGVMSAIAVMAGIATVIYPLGDVFKALAKQRILVALNLIQLPILIASVILAASSGILAVAWARTGAMVLFAVLFLWQVKRILKVSVADLWVAVLPAVITATSLAAAAGAVRLAWPALTLPALIAEAAAAALAGAIALRAAAPDVFGGLAGWIGARIPRRRAVVSADA